MPRIKIFHVKLVNDDWVIKIENNDVLATTNTKIDAIRHAMELAKGVEFARVVIYKSDGKVDFKRNYPHKLGGAKRVNVAKAKHIRRRKPGGTDDIGPEKPVRKI